MPSRTSFLTAARRKGNVMKAVMLRDMRTRFFDHGLGFLIVIFFPLGHMMILLLIYSVLGRSAPYGDSLMLFFGTGLVPTLAFMYVSRMMVVSIQANRPMLSFPAIRVTDIIFGRAVLEVFGSCMMAVLVVLIFALMGQPALPIDVPNAVSALAATLVLAIGVGFLMSLAAAIIPAVAMAYMLATILVYILSGTLFVASSLPAPVIEVLAWNPVLHGVEWLRSAYYLDYPTQVLDKGYLIACGAITLLLGLLVERYSRTLVY